MCREASGIAFATRERGWVAAQRGVIFFTADGGEKWTSQGPEVAGFFVEPRLGAVATTDGRTVVAFGSDTLGARPGGTLNFPPAIVRTTDGGASWSPAQIESGVLATSPGYVACLHESGVGLAITIGYDGAHVFKSADAGASWSIQRDPGIFASDVACVDRSNLWVVGNGLRFAIRSRDAGRTWADVSDRLAAGRPFEPPERGIDRIAFVDSRRGWIFGSEMIGHDAETGDPQWRRLVLETDDGGDRWRTAELPEIEPLGDGALGVVTSGGDLVAMANIGDPEAGPLRGTGAVYADGAWTHFELPRELEFATRFPAAIAE